jgi:cell division protein ZapD
MTYVVGLTGGIGSGKSAVADVFSRLGITVVDADAIAHELTAPGGAGMPPIAREFGPEYVTPEGALDRARMRALAFSDPQAKDRLEAILHPMIRDEGDRRIKAAQGPYAILMVPLLFEKPALSGPYQRALVVDVPEEVQVERVVRRSGLPQEQVRSIMAAQASRATRLAHATEVIENTGTLQDLEGRVALLHEKYLKAAEAWRNGEISTGEISDSAAGGLVSAPANGRESPHSPGAESPLIVYEYPLTEKIRTLLRLEDLFERVRHFLGGSDAHDHHAVLLTLFEIMEVTSRADLKSDLLQELERQKQVLQSFKSNPDVAQDALAAVIGEVEQALAALFNMTGKIGQYLRENEWLMSIKQRTGIPGGACEFDLPSYHYWLHRDSAARSADIDAWISPLYPLRDGSAIVLKLLREGGKPARQLAGQGTFSQMLGGRTSQLVRIRLPRETQFIPEISANKYALNVRFTVFGQESRPRVADSDVEFELTFCNL